MKAMKQWLATGLACAMSAGVAWGFFATSGAVTVRSLGGYDVEGYVKVGCPPFMVESGGQEGIWLDGEVLFSRTGGASFYWYPQTLGVHELEFRLNGVAVTSKTVNVTSLVATGPEALASSADPRLAEKITTVEAYDAFRAWMEEKDLDLQDLKDSPHAWPSFVLGTAKLLANEPTIRIGGISFAPGEAKSAEASPSLKIRVTVKDGGNAASVDADKVAALFEATRQIGDWTESSLLPLAVTSKGTDGDTLLFEATLDGEASPGAFLRLGE